jgi:hypothetical protein
VLVGHPPGQAKAREAAPCGAGGFAYAGLRSDRRVHGVAATLVPVAPPSVAGGHVAGWIGVSGGGPDGTGGWLQVGLATLSGEVGSTSELYYEVAAPGARPYSVQIDPEVAPGRAHRVAVLEMSGRTAWWRVWVDKRPVSPPVHLAGSGGGWYPQAVGENADGGIGACNRYAYSFTGITTARASGGSWRPLQGGSLFADAGYRAVETSSVPRSFVATSR